MNSRWLFMAVFLCITTPAFSADFICKAKGVMFAEWHNGDFMPDEEKLYNEPCYTLLFRTGDKPAYAWFDGEKNNWVWEKLFKSRYGDIYYGEDDDGDYVSAIFTDDKYLILNHTGRFAEGSKEVPYSNAEYAICRPNR